VDCLEGDDFLLGEFLASELDVDSGLLFGEPERGGTGKLFGDEHRDGDLFLVEGNRGVGGDAGCVGFLGDVAQGVPCGPGGFVCVGDAPVGGVVFCLVDDGVGCPTGFLGGGEKFIVGGHDTVSCGLVGCDQGVGGGFSCRNFGGSDFGAAGDEGVVRGPLVVKGARKTVGQTDGHS